MRPQLWAIFLAVAAPIAHAQRECVPGPAIDSISTNIVAAAWGAGGKDPLRGDEAHAVVDAIARGLTLPTVIPVVALDGAAPRSAAVVHGTMLLELAAGRVTSATIVTSTGSDELDSAFTAAAARADRAGAFGRIRPRVPRTRIVVALTTVADADRGGHDHGGVWPVARVTLPRWTLDHPAMLRAWNPQIHYPPPTAWSTDGQQIAEPQLLRDVIDLSYIVDAAGLIESPSIEVGAASYEVTLDSVESVLPELGYAPAIAGGCPTPQLVRQQFAFVGQDTAHIDQRLRPPATVHVHGDSILGAPAVVVTESRCTMVPARDSVSILRVWGPEYEHDAYDFRRGVQALRVAGSPAPPSDALAVCTPDLVAGQVPKDPPYLAKPGYEPVLRSATIIADIRVDTTGHAVKGGIRLVGASDPNAGRGMVKWLEDARYVPASIGGRKYVSWFRLNYQMTFVPSSWYN